MKEVKLDAKGRITVNENYQTSNPKCFAAGDAMNGGVEVVNAAAEAKRAAHGIDRYLKK
ncbi:MAG: FAD-dependent oxidoreductase [Flavobacteriales bacterium]|nr:FAD-dependent oxidoreductase [Flavobacteriales bacterium]